MRHLSPLQTKGMRLRIRLLAGVLAVGCLGGLVGRLAVLQLVDADGYAARASDQQLRGATLPAGRLPRLMARCWLPARPAGPSVPPRGSWPTSWWSLPPKH